LLLLLKLTFDKAPASLLELDVDRNSEACLVVRHSCETVATRRVEGVAVRDVVVHYLHTNTQTHHEQVIDCITHNTRWNDSSISERQFPLEWYSFCL